MINNILSPEFRNLIQVCREILLKDWDPIGVTKFPDFDLHTEDEYDGYARKAATLLAQNCDEKVLYEFFVWAEQNMGLEPNTDKAKLVAEKLVQFAQQD